MLENIAKEIKDKGKLILDAVDVDTFSND